MQDLKVAFIQSELHWHDPSANRAMFEEKIWQIESAVDLIILPEMFTTGFSMDASSLAEVMNTTTVKWMQQMASQKQAVITGSVIIKDKGQYFNRLLWVNPDGSYQQYDKRHLFRNAGEHNFYLPGKDRLITTVKGWKVCPLICYDLRFPVWSRNSFEGDVAAYDLLLYVANWPDKRVNAWDSLLQARAVENLSYSIGVNRIGHDGNDVKYCGHSAAYNYKGDILHAPSEKEETVIVTLEHSPMQDFRTRFPFYLDADKFDFRR